MKIEIAKDSGFCAGVKQATKMAEEEAKEDRKHKTYGPLIHNPQYVEYLRGLGLAPLEGDNISDGNGTYLVTRAHGLPKIEFQYLEENGYNIIDATCPILKKIYTKMQDKEEDGYEIIIIGDKNHPEVKGMAGQVKNQVRFVSNSEEAEAIRGDKLYVISQTTNRLDYFEKLSSIIEKNNDQVLVESTRCQATIKRQESCQELAKKSDLMVVIGGKNSSNTNKLASLSREYCQNVWHIESAEELSSYELQKLPFSYTIGVTAGASTPDWIIEEVVERMDDQITNEEFMDQVEDSMVKIYPKDIVKGTVIAVKDTEVYVNINYRADGIIKLDEMSNDPDVKPQDLYEPGQEIDVYVIKLDDGEGNVALSTRRVEGLKNWQSLVDAFENDEVVEVQITGDNKGGLITSCKGIQGFMPASHIHTYYVRDFKQFVGQTMDAKIISIDERKRRIVLSHKVIEEEKQKEVWKTIEVGETMKGTVARLTDFGAFVNLGGVDGLIHISDISWNRINKPSDVLSVGQEVEVLVLRANEEKNRISLGLKQLTEKPFEVFLKNNKVGDVVKGTVVNLVDFGAFVRLEEGVEGLVHVSQISHERVEKPSDVLNNGDEIEVKIIDINEDEQRIALSIKALLPEPEQKKRERPRRRERPKEDASNYENQELTSNFGDIFDMALKEMNENSEEEPEDIPVEDVNDEDLTENEESDQMADEAHDENDLEVSEEAEENSEEEQGADSDEDEEE